MSARPTVVMSGPQAASGVSKPPPLCLAMASHRLQFSPVTRGWCSASCLLLGPGADVGLQGVGELVGDDLLHLELQQVQLDGVV